MLKSMTGFGRGECIRYNRQFKVEIKSVNHRFSDFNFKGPRFLNAFEDRIRHRLARDIARGKVDVWVNFETFTNRDITVKLSEVNADAYMETLKRISARYNLGELPTGTVLKLLANVPEVIVLDKYEIALSSDSAMDEIWETLSDALEQALEEYNKMRETEGAILLKDIRVNYDNACVLLTNIRARVPKIVTEHTARLREKVADLMMKQVGKVDDGRMLMEIALIADKSDINEELVRLESHLGQLKTMLTENGAIGRKLDFLIQELTREVNTIGSKSTDIQLTQLVVELKSSIEKIREQIQNIE